MEGYYQPCILEITKQFIDWLATIQLWLTFLIYLANKAILKYLLISCQYLKMQIFYTQIGFMVFLKKKKRNIRGHWALIATMATILWNQSRNWSHPQAQLTLLIQLEANLAQEDVWVCDSSSSNIRYLHKIFEFYRKLKLLNLILMTLWNK